MDDRQSQPHHVTHGLLRTATGHIGQVTSMELFFDLVYVFAVTQLSRHLIEHLSRRGAFETTLLIIAVWWAWIDTAWITNWFDPDLSVVRVMLIAAMLLSLVMSASIPAAFGDRGIVFAISYVTTQVGRGLFAVAALRDEPRLQRNFQRITAWSAAAGVGWIVGGLTHDGSRLLIWLIAIIVECSAPAMGFAVPGLGRSTTADWQIAGGHLAERCQAFILIALGESVLDTGATFGNHSFTAAVIAAFFVAFVTNVALWWIYFARAAPAISQMIASSSDPGSLGRSALTYFHVPMVAGIIVTAVAIEHLIAEPTAHPTPAITATVIAGPALFLAGHFLYKVAVSGHVTWSRPAGIVALVLLAPLASHFPALVASGIAAAIVGIVAAWDTVSHRQHIAIADERPVQLEET